MKDDEEEDIELMIEKFKKMVPLYNLLKLLPNTYQGYGEGCDL